MQPVIRDVFHARALQKCQAVHLAILTQIDIIYSGSKAYRNTLKKGADAMLFARNEKGQGLVEYALILVLVAIVVIAALMILGPIIGNTFSTINASLTSV
jgi:pilus assembly protein Flp/PilA